MTGNSDEEVVNSWYSPSISGPLRPLLSAVGGLLFVLVWCDWTMPDCVTGQQGTKAIIEIRA